MKDVDENLYIRILVWANKVNEKGFSWTELKNKFKLEKDQEAWAVRVFLSNINGENLFRIIEGSGTEGEHKYILSSKGLTKVLDYLSNKSLHSSTKKSNSIAMTAVIVAIIVPTFILVLQTHISGVKASNAINEVDNYNLQIACQVKSTYQTNDNLVIQYDTSTYKNNFWILNRQNDGIRKSVRANIALMEASNRMMGILLEDETKRSELKDKLVNNAERIITNLDSYNEQTVSEECAQEEELTNPTT